MLYGNDFNSVNLRKYIRHVQGTYIEMPLQLLKRFPYKFAMFRYSFQRVFGTGLPKRLEQETKRYKNVFILGFT